MTNPDDPAFAHEGTSYLVNKDLEKEFPKEVLEHKLSAISSRYSGLTKREYFAAMAMQGILASQPLKDHPGYWDDLQGIPVSAVRMADATIAELNKETDP